MNAKTHRIVIIEPSFIIQKGICALLDGVSSFTVVHCLPDLQRIEERIAPLFADIFIINPSLFAFHQQPIIHTFFPDKTLVALQYDYFDAEVLKQFAAIITLFDDATKIKEKLLRMTMSEESEENPSENEELSEREKEILICVAKGLMNKEIASTLSISIHTVISHRKNIIKKIGIKSVSGLTVYALLNNLIDQRDVQ